MVGLEGGDSSISIWEECSASGCEDRFILSRCCLKVVLSGLGVAAGGVTAEVAFCLGVGVGCLDDFCGEWDVDLDGVDEEC